MTQTPSPPKGIGTATLTLAGIAAAFGVAACCALPILFASAGIGAAWLGGVAIVAGQPRVAAAFNNLSLGLAVVWSYVRCASRTIQKGQPTFANSKPRVRVFLPDSFTEPVRRSAWDMASEA